MRALVVSLPVLEAFRGEGLTGSADTMPSARRTSLVIIIKHDNKLSSVCFVCHFPNLSSGRAVPSSEHYHSGSLQRTEGAWPRMAHALPLQAHLFSANGAEKLTEIKYCLPSLRPRYTFIRGSHRILLNTPFAHTNALLLRESLNRPALKREASGRCRLKNVLQDRFTRSPRAAYFAPRPTCPR